VKLQYWLYVFMQRRVTISPASAFIPCNCPNNALTG
jgi:hypothetical protein